MLKALALAALLSISNLAIVPALAATTTKTTASKPKATSTTKKSSTATKKSTSKKSTTKKSTGSTAKQSCKSVRTKTASGTRTRTVCTTPDASTLKSPISAGAIENGRPEPSNEVKARSVPDRAYAIDGNTFFHQGKKYRIEGLSAAPGDHGRQRLQMSLDQGSLQIQALSTDETGVTSATVRSGGRSLADSLKTP